jgi:2-polyprenyl-3-methyl-5-hydroxy-6-metoxy-1,4-benzoquinol methylase
MPARTQQAATEASSTESGPRSTPRNLGLPDPRNTRYFPASFQEHLDSKYYSGGIDVASYRNYMRAEIERGREIVRLLGPWTSLEGKSVLDVGCGFGGLLVVMKEAGAAQLAGVEIDSNRIYWAGVRMQEMGYQADLRELDICKEQTLQHLGTYDVILAQDVIEHVADPRVAIRHIAKLLRPGGVVFMQVGNKFSPTQLGADHHYKLPGITMLSRPQAIEYFSARTKLPASDYAVGYWREEKYYRNVFRSAGVALHRVDRFSTTDHVLCYAKSISDLCTKLEGNLWPDLRPELGRRMGRRIRKLAQLYVHASRQLPRMVNDLELLESACDAIVGRLLWDVWRLVGVKNLATEELENAAASRPHGKGDAVEVSRGETR